MKKMDMCVSANSNYARYLYVMLTSLFESNGEDRITVYVLQRDFTESDKQAVLSLAKQYKQKAVLVDINEDEFKVFPTTSHFSMETYFRFKIPDLIPENVHRILYIDVDVIVRDSISELFDIDLKGYYFAACSDIVAEQLTPTKRMRFKRFRDIRYFNAGILMWNLDEIRGNFDINTFVQAGNELNYNLPHVDQDLLNYLYYDKTLYLDPYVYNYLVVDQLIHKESTPSKAKILHYCWYNPWQAGPKTDTYKIWWEYAKKTPYFQDFLIEQLERSESFILEKHMDKKVDTLADTQMFEICECMYELKGKGSIARKAREKDECYVIYGAGLLGKKLYQLLQAERLGDKIKAVFDRNKKGYLEDRDISNVLEELREYKNCIIIVTPFNNADAIVADVSNYIDDSTRIITLLDFLMEVAESEKG